MVKVVNNSIYLTRGDSAYLSLGIGKADGTDYELEPNDVVFFTIKKNTADKNVVIQKTAIAGKIIINPEETANLPYGNYVYDVELRKPNGFVSTVIPPSLFRLTEEVTFK